MTRVRRSRGWLAAGGAALVGAAMLAWLPADAATTPAASGDGGDKPVVVSKTLTREFVNDDGSTYDFDSHDVAVTASPTTNLRGRQRVQISWTGAQPSAARASNPYGENGLNQEYPVVVLQCRGTDSTTVPVSQQVTPETCFTNSMLERSQISRSDGEASWTHDEYADPSQKLQHSISGDTPYPGTDVCPTASADGLYTHLTPFISAKGQVFDACDADHMPPEAGVGAAYPPAEIAAFTDSDGNGSVQFEVRSDVENESLGCNDKTPCTIEVIPINGLSCEQQADPPTISDSACRTGGQFAPGSSNFANQTGDQAVSWPLWWSATNWNNRIAVPVTFGLPPDTCDILDPRAPTGFYGSELLAQASLQWAPAYCLDKKRFKYQHNVMSDDAGFALMDAGGGAAALVSSEHKKTAPDPVGYAPTAVTGFGIGYVIDRPDNAGEYTDLRLDPRLVAKLLTQSYLGSSLGVGHPGIGDNPLGIMNDPEFIELNPGLSQTSQEAGAALMSLSIDSDVIQQLTDWIAHDKDAMAFVDGKPDPWGMKVNPAYKKLKLPRQDIPLKDTYIPTTSNACRQANPNVYFNQLAAPVSTLRIIAQALLDGWPLVQTRCDFDLSTQSYKQGRVDRQSYGARFVMGIVSLGDAQRYGLRTAALQTKKGTYVAPSDASLAAAVTLAQQPEKKGKPIAGSAFELDQADIRKSGKAYPGTMVVYTAARERDLDKADAAKVAQFIHVSTTEGQKAGTGNGDLPPGFLPITKTGATRKLYDSAQQVATEVTAQTPKPTAKPSPTASAKPSPSATTDSTHTSTTGGHLDGGGVDHVPSAGVPSESATAAPSASPSQSASARAVEMPQTEAVNSDLGHRTVPVLLALAMIGIALASAARFFVKPPRGPQA